MKKRVLSLLLLVCMLCTSLLSACNTQGTNNPSGSTETESEFVATNALEAMQHINTQELNIIDDSLFQKMAEDMGFCEEMISTILGQKVIINNFVPQNSIKNLQGRSVVLDALCTLENGKECNVEVQK